MSKNSLDELFGSRVRVKIMKFFFRNYPSEFDVRTLTKKLQEPSDIVRQEVESLRSIGLLKRKS